MGTLASCLLSRQCRTGRQGQLQCFHLGKGTLGRGCSTPLGCGSCRFHYGHCLTCGHEISVIRAVPWRPVASHFNNRIPGDNQSLHPGTCKGEAAVPPWLPLRSLFRSSERVLCNGKLCNLEGLLRYTQTGTHVFVCLYVHT